MEKYRIAVGVPTLEDCSLEAIACSEHLKKKGIHSEWENRHYFFRVNTEKGHIEFIPYENFKIKYIFLGKKYSAMFNVPRDADKSFYPGVTILTSCFLDWVEIAESAKEEKDEKTYDELPCSYCKSLPICSAKDEFHDLQKMLNMSIEKTSKVFKEAKLVCPYYNPDIPMAACV